MRFHGMTSVGRRRRAIPQRRSRFARGFFLILFPLLWAGFTEAGASTREIRSFPLPLAEMTSVVSRWVAETEPEFTRETSQEGAVELAFEGKGRQPWRILLRPRSPLATEISVEITGGDERLALESTADLWLFIGNHLGDTQRRERNIWPSIPLPVSRLGDAALCILARNQERNINISGFAIDSRGWILCTAHDLKGNQKVEVRMGNGRVLEGRVLKLDPFLDLALVGVDASLPTVISPKRSRLVLNPAEPLFSITCSETGETGIHSGSMDGFPRRMNGLILWQVKLDVLPGNSGSPVLDAEGHLVGVVKGRYRGTENTGFLIPVSTIIDFLSGEE